MRKAGIIIGSVAAGWCAVAAVAATGKPAAPGKAVKAAPVSAKATAPAQPVRAADPGVSPDAAEFFETHVRPVLAESCYSCHGPKMQQAGLRVDSLAALLKGTDTGHPALVKGDPEKSPLVQVVRYSGNVKMPPQGKLPQKSIDALTTWVKMGAPWPNSGKEAAAAP
ncbi:MAG TPA: c-type cytochrome domain-containing protein, partial [Armatimonadota bacterium]|nr:c-type cytochrome domain-containing protein [Armatimonadota bacterium]